MKEEIFLKYQQYLFDEKLISQWNSADPIHLYPTPGFKPSPFDRPLREAVHKERDSNNGEREESRQLVPSDYEIGLAAQAYDELFIDRSFEFHEVKAEVFENYLNAWKLEIAEERERDSFFDELKSRAHEAEDSPLGVHNHPHPRLVRHMLQSVQQSK